MIRFTNLVCWLNSNDNHMRAMLAIIFIFVIIAGAVNALAP